MTTREVRLYKRRMPVWWWVRRRTYFLFVMRELSSLFVGWFVVYLLLLVRSVSQGPAAFQDFLELAEAPWMIALNVLALVFLLFHTYTWFALTPKAMVVQIPRHPRVPARLRGWSAPAWLILASQYVGLALVSAIVVLVVTW